MIMAKTGTLMMRVSTDARSDSGDKVGFTD